MKWQAYPKYKESGIEWLGDVPAHWDIRSLKHIASVRFSNVDKKTKEGEQPVRLCNYVDVYYNDYITSDLDFMEATASHTEIAKFILREGDVLITKDSESWDDIAIPAYVSLDLDGVLCGYHLAQIRSNASLIDGEYLFRSFCACGLNDQFRVVATGITRYSLGKYWINKSLFLVPPKDEQHTIAAFLDRETSRIDKLISKKERQIELLQEKRVALISHAVTKGLDPNARMKDSGVEWLGKIPEEWKIVPLKFVIANCRNAIKTGPFGSQLLSSEMLEGNIKVYNQQNILYKDFRGGENYINEEKYEEMKSFTIYPNDVIVTTRGTIGHCALFPPNAELGILHPCLMRIQVNQNRIIPEYLAFLIQDGCIVHIQLLIMSNATTIDVIYSDSLKQILLPLPSVSEQKRILLVIEKEVGLLDRLIDKIKESIELLREYRTSIISAAVTGKIDLRLEIE